MLPYNFKYESLKLLRSQWIQLLTILLIILFGFGAFNGSQKVIKRDAAIEAAKNKVAEEDAYMLKLLDSIEQGLPMTTPEWYFPNQPMEIGDYYPRLAAMPSQSMAFIATGQSDLFTHFVRPKLNSDDMNLGLTEMTSPVQLLFGSFDLAFVIIYLLPLIIIALSYNVLSSERENGTLRVIAAQPIDIRNWVLQKLILRFFWLSIIVVVALLIAFLINGISVATFSTSFVGLLALILAYMLFWFALAYLLNIWGNTSAKNAVSLVGLWVVFVLMMPSVLNQLANGLYPMPSRMALVNELRTVKLEASKKQEEILDGFLQDHPEYGMKDSTQIDFWHNYVATQDLLREELKPVVTKYENQLYQQQQWVERFKWISPTVLVQQTLSKMAGTSTKDYQDYKQQVLAFSENWRTHLIPFLFQGRDFTSKDYPKLPSFEFKPLTHNIWTVIPVLLGFSLVLFAIGFRFRKKVLVI